MDEPTYRKDSSSICTSKLAKKVFEDASPFETQKLINVVSWTELFLDKHHTSDGTREIAQSFVSSALTHDAEIKVTQNITEIQNKKPESFDLELSHTHASNGLSPFVISKNILDQTEKGSQINSTEAIKYDQEHQEEREAMLGGEYEVEVQKYSTRKKAKFQNSYIVCKGDCLISATIDLHENLDSFFWTPLNDSSDEKWTDIVKTKRDTLTKTHINPPSSPRFLKSDHMKHPSISVLGDRLSFTRSASSFEKETLTAENLAEIKENDMFKDFIWTSESDNFSEANDNAENTAEQVRNRNNSFDPEAHELNLPDFQAQKKDTAPKKETKSVCMAETDKRPEENKCTGRKQTDSPSSGKHCTGGQHELELQPLKKNPSTLSNSLCTNSLLKPLGNTAGEVSSDSSDLDYINNYDSVTQNRAPKCVQDDINEYVSKNMIKSTAGPKNSAEEFIIQKVKVDCSKKVFTYAKFLSDSPNEDSILAQYYFYLGYLSQSKVLQPEDNNYSFSCEELHGFSQEEKLDVWSSNIIKDANVEDSDHDFGTCEKYHCQDKTAAVIRPPGEEQGSKSLFTNSCPRSLSHLASTDQSKLGNICSSRGKPRLL